MNARCGEKIDCRCGIPRTRMDESILLTLGRSYSTGLYRDVSGVPLGKWVKVSVEYAIKIE